MKSWLTDLLKRLKPEGLPQWAWGGILLGIIIGGAVLVQQVTASPTLASGREEPLGTAGFVMELMVTLVFIVGILFLGLYYARRWQRGGKGSSSRRLQILESRHLSPRQAVHLIRAGQRVFLVGATDQTISLLSEMEAEAQDGPEETGASFAQMLDQTTRQAASQEDGSPAELRGAGWEGTGGS